MAKNKKTYKKQTTYTKQGKQIADTAVPYYKTNLGRMDSYLQDPMALQNQYLEQYYTNTPQETDFLRNYQRAMGGVTANNYAATNGGYSSLNQMNYDDQQRYQNDLAARLRQAGVESAYNMAQGIYGDYLSANDAYRQAYGLGKEYSDIDQYNYQAKQYNKSNGWLGNVLGAAGQAVSTIPSPWTKAIGGAMQIGGGLVGTDYQDFETGGYGGTRGGTSSMGDLFGAGATNLGAGLKGGYDWLQNKRNKQ